MTIAQFPASPSTHPATLRADLLEAIGRLSEGHMVVVGDVAIDEMIYGRTERLSREAPVLILGHDRTERHLGTAGNAAHNSAALHAARTDLVAVCGDPTINPDDYANHLRHILTRDGIALDGLVTDPSRNPCRPTTTKTRISGIANHSVTQQMVRIDREARHPLDAPTEAAVLAKLDTLVPPAHALLLSDYALGLVTPAVIQRCQALAKHSPHLVFAVDSHRDLGLFAGATVVTPNQPEAEANVGFALDSTEAVETAGPLLLAKTQGPSVLITRGGQGMSLFWREEGQPSSPVWVAHIPAFNKSEVFDVTGAGDTVIATLTLALATGASVFQAAVLGNIAASIVVRRFGTATTTPGELQHTLIDLGDSPLAGIVVKPLQ